MKKLVTHNPQWLMKGDQRVGLIFTCPTRPDEQQTCFFAKTPRNEQIEAIRSLVGNMQDDDEPDLSHIQLCDEDCGWTCSPPVAEATFENISIQPSLDGSKGGNWHGFITNGECDAC